ncbi:MAG TPA: OmpA family protein [Kofleriaceae bacterium]
MHRSFSAPGSGLALAVVALGVCLLAASCGGPSQKPGCKSDKDCKNHTVCAAGKCVECTEDAQCGPGKHCTANACVAAPECLDDKQCPAGQVCQAGKCKACASDAECGPGGMCEAGACKGSKPCTKDDQCADDEDCAGGFCRKAGGASAGDATCTLSTVYFAFDDSTVAASERDRLAANVACIEKTRGKNVFLFGHTDSSGTEEYNIALSERRAQAVADYMARLGTDPARMQVVPKGETQPTGLGDDKDRRVELQWH